MGRRKQAPAPPLRSASLEGLGPLTLNPAEVARVGIVRASFDAVHALPAHAASWDAARASRDEAARADHNRAASALARRTAEAHAKRTASFTRPEDRPPF